MKHKIRWTLEKVTQRLELISPLVYTNREPLAPFLYRELASPEIDPPISPDIDDHHWDKIPFHSYWGKWRTDFVLRTRFSCPQDWDSSLPVALYLPLGDSGDFIHPEALAYIDGTALASCDRYHHEIVIPDNYRDGREHLLALHGWTGLGGWREPDSQTQLYLRPCFLVQIETKLRAFIATARIAIGIAGQLNDDHPTKSYLLSGLNEAFTTLETKAPLEDEFYLSVPLAHKILQEAVKQAGMPINMDVTAVGHAHIDVAWLWTLGQTRRKAGRTFHNVINLMERFPEFKFTQSQPQLYDYVRQDYPKLFESIKQKVVDGQWEAIGGMWVEADCNITGSESLARQFLLGRSFFQRHFGKGKDSPILWLPDVFGYAWNLPQLIKQAGLEYFFTIKIGWSQYNRMPYDSFWWQGLDGTRVLTHYSTTTDSENSYASTYNARVTPEEAVRTWTNFQQKDLGRLGKSPPVLMAFGHGDGGGGPTEEMLENVQEMANFPGVPRIQFGTARAFFEDLDEQFGDVLPVWNGELYLEYHRGTYTTQARNKRANRKSEILLQNAEFLAVLAEALDDGYRYPDGKLAKSWELVCLNQFHDIIPGSSINEVYVDSLAQYQEVREIGQEVREHVLEVLGNSTTDALQIANCAPVNRNDLLFIEQEDLPLLAKVGGSPARTQKVDGGVLLDPGELNPYSITSFEAIDGIPREFESTLSVSERHLENAWIRVQFDQQGDITRIFDKKNIREILPKGQIANQFQAFEDRPMRWDAWDIDIYYDDRVWFADPASSIEVVEKGPLRVTLLIRRRILASEYVQRISLTAKSPELIFENWINWQQEHVLLKVAFPVNILTSFATYEVQWGHVQRPTHRNTSWDWARFETCAHKWADVSEANYGVSLLNDCKYGYDVQDSVDGTHSVMRLSLLRSPTYPDPVADQGEHRFAYTLFPHEGRVGSATIAKAYALNNPLLVKINPDHPQNAMGRGLPNVSGKSWIRCNHPNIIIETIKKAEDGDGIILRLYDSLGQRGAAELITTFHVNSAWQTNLLEENQNLLAVTDGKVQFNYRPFQIITLRLQRESWVWKH